MRKIILVGYMGVGKTTIAQLLAKKMKCKWVDLDKVIENKLNLTINEIFKQKGEIYFRKVEYEQFKSSIENDEHEIISVGGGTPCYANNHELMNGENIVSIYLNASINTLFDRLKKAKNERPLVANQSETTLKEFIAKNLFERSYFYNQATFKINVDSKTPKEIVDDIFELLD